MKINNKNKFVKGNLNDFDNSKGWFIGQFMNNYGRKDLETDEVEICWRILKVGHKDLLHYHKKGVEIAIVISGWFEALVEGQLVRVDKKDFLVVYPKGNLELKNFKIGTEVLVVKAPSVANDKFEVSLG